MKDIDPILSRIPDYNSHSGAALLAARITDFWAREGFDVRISVVPVAAVANGNAMYGLKSDMINGWPRFRRHGVGSKR